MDTIKTYAVGDRTITLTADEAENLRIILQKDYVESVVNEIISAAPDDFHFTSEMNRARFTHIIADAHDDYINLYGCYEEILDEAIYQMAREYGIGG